MHHLPLIVTVALATCAIVGCRNSVNMVGNADKTAIVTPIKDARLITDRALDDTIAVVQLHTATSPQNLLRIQAEMVNCKNSKVSLLYSVEWFDAQGMIVHQAGGGPRELEFQARESLSISAVAPSSLAKDFRFKLQERQY